jgi:hypothetical protein
MKTVRVEQSATAGELFDQAAGEPVLLRVPSGRAFVLVEVDRDDAETLALADNAKFNDILNRSRARARREGWLSTEQVRGQLAIE